MRYNLVLNDNKKIHYFTVLYNPYIKSIEVKGEIVKKLKPINLKYSEIKSLVNQIDSVERVEDYIEIRVDSNSNLLLKVSAWKDYKRIGKRNAKQTKVVFQINVHNKKVLKVGEKKYESFWAE